jgi:uncharacterized membrane protein
MHSLKPPFLPTYFTSTYATSIEDIVAYHSILLTYPRRSAKFSMLSIKWKMSSKNLLTTPFSRGIMRRVEQMFKT